jgi:large subunit ribosomal protein L3
VVTQIKTPDTDGYTAIQVGFEETTEKALNRPKLGHLARSGSAPQRYLQEYRVEAITDYELGQTITATSFSVGQLVDVTGKSIGRGFAGYQKRHNFRRGPMAHGSKNHRLPGSTGAGTTPGRVYPGKRMAGQLGNSQVTIRKLEVIRVDGDRNLLLIKGAVPGKPGGLLSLTPAKWVKG